MYRPDAKQFKSRGLPASFYPMAVAMVLMIFFFGTSSGQSVQKICSVTCISYPGRDAGIWNALYAASDGKIYSGLSTHGGSAHFYQYDPVTNVHKNLIDLSTFLGERSRGIRSSGKIHTPIVEAGAGNLYFATLGASAGPQNINFTSWRSGFWIRYNMKENRFEKLALIEKGVGLYNIAIDNSGRYLYGLGFKGYLYQFDIRNSETKNLGRVSN